MPRETWLCTRSETARPHQVCPFLCCCVAVLKKSTLRVHRYLFLSKSWEVPRNFPVIPNHQPKAPRQQHPTTTKPKHMEFSRCSRPKCRQWRPDKELQRQVAFAVHKAKLGLGLLGPVAVVKFLCSLIQWIGWWENLNRKPARFSHEDHGMFL